MPVQIVEVEAGSSLAIPVADCSRAHLSSYGRLLRLLRGSQGTRMGHRVRAERRRRVPTLFESEDRC